MNIRKVLWIALAVVVAAFTIHTIINGLPDLGSLNPHG